MEPALREAILLHHDFDEIILYLQEKLNDPSVCLSVEMLKVLRNHPVDPIRVPVVGNESYIRKLQLIPWFKYGIDKPVIFEPLEDRWPFMRVPVAIGVIFEAGDISNAINSMNNDLTSRPIIILGDGIEKPTSLELCYAHSHQIVSWPPSVENLHGMAAWLVSGYELLS